MSAMEWEYIIVQQPEALNDYGLEGWELVSVVQVANHLNHYFKRPAPDFRQRLSEEQRQQVYAQFKRDP